MYLAKIYTKGGNVIEVNLKDLTETKNGLGQLTKLKWANETKEKQLVHLDLDSIEAIVVDEID